MELKLAAPLPPASETLFFGDEVLLSDVGFLTSFSGESVLSSDFCLFFLSPQLA